MRIDRTPAPTAPLSTDLFAASASPDALCQREPAMPPVIKPSRLRIDKPAFIGRTLGFTVTASAAGLAGIGFPPLLAGLAIPSSCALGVELGCGVAHDLYWSLWLPRLRTRVAKALEAHRIIDRATNEVIGRDVTAARLAQVIRPIYYASDLALNDLAASLRDHAMQRSGSYDIEQQINGFMDVDRPAVMWSRAPLRRRPRRPAAPKARPVARAAQAPAPPMRVLPRNTHVVNANINLREAAYARTRQDDRFFAMQKVHDVYTWLVGADLLTPDLQLTCAASEAAVAQALEAAGLFEFGWPHPRAAQTALAQALLRLQRIHSREQRLESVDQVSRVIKDQLELTGAQP